MIANVCVTAGLSYVSHYNYPGGKAMEALHEFHHSLAGATVAGNQTGELEPAVHFQWAADGPQCEYSCRPDHV
jgi:hypothetical protein